RYQREQDSYVHEAAHALLHVNNLKYRQSSEKAKELGSQIMKLNKEFDLKVDGVLSDELLPLTKRFIELNYINTVYEEMIASLAGHHLHQMPDEKGLQEKKQKLLQYSNALNDITQ